MTFSLPIRPAPDARPPGLLFPQMTNPEYAEAHWQPEFVDYLYVSFTNSTAFSPRTSCR